MKRVILSALFLIFFLAAWGFEPVKAAEKPNVTRHEATFLENAVNMHIEWQSPNPVTLVKVSMPSVIKEISIDPYDNRRNPYGYSGEVDVTLAVSGLSGQTFSYVIQLQDELRIRSEPVTGQVKVTSPQQPGMVPVMPAPMPAPPIQIPPLPAPQQNQTPQGMPQTGMPSSPQPGGSPGG